MVSAIGKRFRRHIDDVSARVGGLPEDAVHHPIRAGGWSGKQVLGHLIDSALNNHQRFVRAALDGSYEGPTYEQNGWVDLHGYGELAWSELLTHWREQNQLLCRVVERIAEDRMAAVCRVGSNEAVTLEYLIEDYLRHMDHHIEQITGGGG
jgi:hypothetical protein